MSRIHQGIGLAMLMFVLTGCVAQEKYTTMKLERDRYAEQLSAAQTAEREAVAQNALLKQQLAALSGSEGGKEAMMANLMSQNTELEKQVADLKARLENSFKDIGSYVALPAMVNSALEDMARQYPDVVEFDASRGIVKFKSDLTFAKGSAELTSQAKAVIARFAQIVSSGPAAGYDLRVEGHTDNTPVVQAQTKAQHPNNWYLSAHRAISVNSELMGHGVSPKRLGVAGYAEQRPVASNDSSSGQAMNRRVEVLILPSTGHGTALTNVSPTRSKAPRLAPTMDKDSVNIDSRPILNK